MADEERQDQVGTDQPGGGSTSAADEKKAVHEPSAVAAGEVSGNENGSGSVGPRALSGKDLDRFTPSRARRGGRDSDGDSSGKPGGPRRGPRRNEDKEEGSGDGIIDTVVKINRCAKVVKGGRRFSFSALVVAGDTKGRVGVGLGKAPEVPTAVNKAVISAKREMIPVSLLGTTIPHEVEGRYGSAIVRLLPAVRGTGIIAGGPVRAVMTAVGIHDILTKTYGTNNPINIVKATIEALALLRNKNEVEKLRGVKI